MRDTRLRTSVRGPMIFLTSARIAPSKISNPRVKYSAIQHPTPNQLTYFIEMRQDVVDIGDQTSPSDYVSGRLSDDFCRSLPGGNI